MDEHSIRIVVLDYYMSPPIVGLDFTYSEFRSSSINKVPVLRCFGSTSAGQKVCIHIHGVFPYIYIPYDESENANTLMYQIAANLDKAINISMNQMASNTQHVYKIQLVSGIPMYGYHSKKHQFFKIYLYNPLLVSKVNALLQNDQILGRIYQPHESHLNFTLQFMIDYNLHGMSTMKVTNLKFRGNPTSFDNDLHLPTDIHKITTCELEGDILAEHILNRQEIGNGELSVNPGIAALWEDEKQRRRIKNEDSQLTHFLEMSRTDVPPTNSHLIYKKALLERLAILEDGKSTDDSGNTSVYPAETPESSNIQNASTLDLGTPSSLEMSLDETISPTTNSDTLNVTLDADAQDLVDILENLERNTDESLVEDSILSQVVKEEDESVEELDMTMPLEAMTTPRKILVGQDDDDSDENSCDVTLIPQLDGFGDELDEKMDDVEMVEFQDHDHIFQENGKSKTEGQKARNMPSLNTENFQNKSLVINLLKLCDKKSVINFDAKKKQPQKLNEKTNLKVIFRRPRRTYRKKSTQEKLDLELRNLSRRVKKLNEADRIKQIMTVVCDKEHRTNKMLSNSLKPKFNIVPGKKIEDNKHKSNNIPSLLIEILKQTHNYIDPNLHFKVKLPDNSCFLYYYKENNIPNIFQLPNEHFENPQTHDYYLRTRDRERLRKVYENACAPESEYENEKDPDFKCNVKIKNTNLGPLNKPIDASTYYRHLLHDCDFNSLVHNAEVNTILEKKLERRPPKILPANLKETFEVVNKKLQEFLSPNMCVATNKSSREIKNNRSTYFSDSVNKENCQETYFSSLEEREKVISGIKCLNTVEGHEKNLSGSEFFNTEKEREKIFSSIKCLNTESNFDHVNYSSMSNLIKQPKNQDIPNRNGIVKKYSKNNKLEIKQVLSNSKQFSDEYFKEAIPVNNSGKIVVSSVYVIRPIKALIRKQVCDTNVTVTKVGVDVKSNAKYLGCGKNLFSRFSDSLKMLPKYGLDGANDSSSEDEISLRKKMVKKCRSDSPRYSQLPVSVASISKSKKTNNLKEHKNDNLEVNRSDEICDKKLTIKVPKLSTVQTKCDTVKRKLDFCPTSSQHNLTIVEEHIACNYSPSLKKQVENIKSYSDSSSSDGDIFSSSDSEQNNMKRDVNLTTSEIYDIKRNFEPQAETSTRLSGTQVCKGNSQKSSNSPKNSQTSLNMELKVFSTIKKPPTYLEVKESLDSLKIPHVRHQEPFYSNVEDVTGSVEIGYNVLKISSKTTADLSEFESAFDGLNKLRKTAVETTTKWSRSSIKNLVLSFCQDRRIILKPIRKPPSFKEVENWIKDNSKVVTPAKNVETKKIKVCIPTSPNEDEGNKSLSLSLSSCTPIFSNSSGRSEEICLRNSVLSDDTHSKSCEITGVTQNNTFGFNQSVQNFQKAKAIVEHQNLTIMVVELHIRTRGDFKPNPELDAICAIFYSVLNDVPENHPKQKKLKGVLAVNSLATPILNGISDDSDITYVDSEKSLVEEFLKLLSYWDPDILAGYEIQMLSWGYLIERAYILNINLIPLLGRSEISLRNAKEQNDLENITGRIVLDVWRLMRHEIALQSYSFESIVYHILHKRVPMYTFKDLSFWWDHKTFLYRYRTAEYYLFRVETILELFDKLDLIGRTSELARLFGIQFYEVLSRGSQFRVESMMLRLAKPLNFIPVSPSVSQRAQMKAPEYIPLVMEPESRLYTDPVIVLDFQSLYPSIIIAYNYCFTTCVGRVECLGKNNQFKFGATNLKVPRRIVKRLADRDLLNVSPCAVAFVKTKVRDGVLPTMLREILDTRLMVKNSMKENKDDGLLKKVLHNRQLGLKLIANVTYGYTAANFSGRMCCVEVGDSVVSKGRETLQRAIALVENTPEWGARVVYGDTDSLFVSVAGKGRAAAFEVGAKIANAVTGDNPDPIKLKLEKVYQPCILQTKKRYVGYMYESVEQKEPVYDAKGIETVRRDGCPAVAKILEKCLRLLFETRDVSEIKKYVMRQFSKIISGKASIQDLTFAKEYRGAAGYKPGACVPALELSRKWTTVDKRNEPRCGERVPYIIVNGPPGLPLIRLVRSPRDLLEDPSLRPNATYYITKVIIPPLNRCFNLIGADMNVWFNQMPRKIMHVLPTSSPSKKNTISQYFATTSCASCGELSQNGLCESCGGKPQETYITLMEKLRLWEQNSDKTILFCQSCTGFLGKVPCASLDCPILYRRIQTSQGLQQTTYVRQLLSSMDYLF